MESFSNALTLLCSVVIATAISLASFLYETRKHRQTLMTQAVTANRIAWISEVRILLINFLLCYIDKEPQANLNKIRIKIRLYFHNEGYYKSFFSCLKKCCEEPYSEQTKEELIKETQSILKSAWTRIKIEGGQQKKDDLRVRKLVKNYLDYDSHHT